jgi:hypothetical protein
VSDLLRPGLHLSIEEEDDKMVRKGLSGKVAEVQAQLEQTEMTLAGLKAEYESRRNVVNVESAYEYLKIFKNGAFDSQPLSVQAEILRLRVRRIVVQEDGVTVEIFGRRPEVLLLAQKQTPDPASP